MSNILATVGRNVQYINKQGQILAAIITSVGSASAGLAVFDETNGVYFVPAATEFDPRARNSQTNTFKLTWQGR
jgi:hypothetical protein